MKIAFLISAHTDPQHLLQLVRSLPDGSEMFVHLDRKSDLSAFASVADMPHVHFIGERYDVMWGSMLQVDYQRALLRAALSAPTRFDYLFTLSGLDYPVWSNERIVRYLEEHRGDQFIQGICMTRQGSRARLYQEYRLLNNHNWRYGTLRSKFRVALRKSIYALGVRKPLTVPVGTERYELYKGSDWWAITSDLAAYALQFIDEHPEFVAYFKNSFCPSETIWQTIAFHSPYADLCIRSEGDFTRLEDYTPLTYIEYGDEIKVLTESDYDAIMASGKMFCRKTVSGRSDRLIEMIDQQRRNG